jgi:hypothetical protein
MNSTHPATPSDTPQAACVPSVCPACGGVARRASARFCATCGRSLGAGDYLPTDTLRASYHHQHNRPPLVPGHQPHRACIGRFGPARDPRAEPQDGVLRIARALVVYALIPYLGILFCPCAVIMGGSAWLYARRAPECGSPRAAVRYVILAIVIFYAQTFLWRLSLWS